jgi:hypothetical protein
MMSLNYNTHNEELNTAQACTSTQLLVRDYKHSYHSDQSHHSTGRMQEAQERAKSRDDAMPTVLGGIAGENASASQQGGKGLKVDYSRRRGSQARCDGYVAGREGGVDGCERGGGDGQDAKRGGVAEGCMAATKVPGPANGDGGYNSYERRLAGMSGVCNIPKV